MGGTCACAVATAEPSSDDSRAGAKDDDGGTAAAVNEAQRS
jgi:hypothetical protein